MFDVKIDMSQGFKLFECHNQAGKITYFSPGALKGYLSGEYQERKDGLKIYQGGEYGDGTENCVVEYKGMYNVLGTEQAEWLLGTSITPLDSSGYVEATPEEFRAFAEEHVAE
ncbi:hypothetical protein MQM1_056 [Aeromonas phage vB_AsaP_MQM1]|nr:hypothetical protein MQM1_056 [Aeromonas phage vB_AsaP_MQM1]